MQSRPGGKGIVHLVESWLTCTEPVVQTGNKCDWGGGGQRGGGLQVHEEIAVKLLEPSESFRKRVSSKMSYRRRKLKRFSEFPSSDSCMTNVAVFGDQCH